MLTRRVRTMEKMVEWWCNFVGITDPTAVQIATGVFGGGLALVAIFVTWQLIVELLKFISGR
jgi:hypothetical protein